MLHGLIRRIGLSPKLLLGYAGVLVFMMGEGLEQGWLSPYLIGKGLTIQESALLFSVYGFAAAIAAWFSGVLAEIFTARRVMLAGLVLFLIGSVLFLTFGLPSNNLAMMVPTYAMRGLGYPLFAYGFLVWVAYEAPPERLGSAVGIFWFVYSGGLSVLGVLYSSVMLPYLGEIHTLWSALIFVVLGALIALLLNRNNGVVQTGDREKASLSYVLKGITIAFENPKIGLGGIVRTINTSAAYGFVVFMPMYMMDMGFTRTHWLQMYAALWTVNIIFNLIFGVISDGLGWRNVVMWFGCVGCAITTLMFYYVPQFFGANYLLTVSAAGLFGACLAAFVPLSAIMPSLAPENKGAAMSILNLGAGLSTFVGPAVVGLFIGSLGTVGVIWIFTGMYLFSGILMKFVTLPKENVTVVKESNPDLAKIS
ncbi:MFS transporter [Serratia quinivorans]|uniref:MFS transporter n=1 Tax=Serratia quinivorans TaxID=137545 RepID=UPI002178E0FF|nr:MFS transporter [Serratia quinivorans]CAI0690440.1 Alpha-ketoglutarate permease [Serratia quinivorans]CAI0690998.1 Alpha-ketoglutarate permease [Serratia quinivorans]CAI0718486.1 Alpha-ketoglutarate permease [Serratia quinivorans]CAI1626603.1 Alpha-ketoglutarate permease [Serratia quinivorans]CAI2039594.1 Alpha-ketoglutarate permease [Serratia quinivorans]